MWNLWCTHWHWDGFLSEYFIFPLSVSLRQWTTVFIIYILLLREGQTWEIVEFVGKLYLSLNGGTLVGQVLLCCWLMSCCRRCWYHSDVTGLWDGTVQSICTGHFQILRGIWNSEYSNASFYTGSVSKYKMLLSLECSLFYQRITCTLSMGFFAGFPGIIHHVLGLIFSSVLMICINQFFIN
jgi:hypothetical protein